MTASLGRRIGSTSLALLVILTAVVGGFSAPAAAATTNECSTLDGFIYDVLSFQPFDSNSDNPCSTGYAVNQAVEEMNAAEDNQTKLDIRAAGESQVAQWEVHNAVWDNYYNDTQQIAWLKAETAVAEAYENGSTEAQAVAAAKKAIQDYYTTKQINLIEQSNVTVETAADLEARADQEGIDEYFVSIYGQSAASNPAFEADQAAGTLTLLNGSTRDVTGIDHDPGSAGEVWYPTVTPYWSGVALEGVRIQDPNNAHTADHLQSSDLQYLHYRKYNARWNRLVTASDSLETEVDPFVTATWAEFEAGNINSSDVLSRTNLMFEYGTDSYNGSAGFHTSIAALSSMGVATPDLNSSGTFDVTYQNVGYNGMVLARDAPNGSWNANTTYNASNIAGPVMLATTGGQFLQLSGEFRIGTMTDKAGNSVSSVNTTQYNYRTANTSELNAKLTKLLELRQEIEEYQSSIGGGSSSGGIGNGEMLLAGIALVALLALVANEGKNGGRY